MKVERDGQDKMQTAQCQFDQFDILWGQGAIEYQAYQLAYPGLSCSNNEWAVSKKVPP